MNQGIDSTGKRTIFASFSPRARGFRARPTHTDSIHF
jgi:hypothetical protein